MDDGHFSQPFAIAADAYGHLLVLDMNTERLQVLESNGTHINTRKDLGIYKGECYKGLEWCGEEGRLAIANGSGNYALVYNV